MARSHIANKREFLLLAQVFDRAKHGIGGWFLSEKCDGQRAFWDGGITRGLYANEVPFANTEKDGIRVNPPTCTGLWSRHGKPIQAPMWFCDRMPPFPLDGELFAGNGGFQDVMSTCRKLVPVDDEWARIHYLAFDLPDYSQVFADGNIRSPNFEKTITGVIDWLHNQKVCKWRLADAKVRRFETVVHLLHQEFGDGAHPVVRNVSQEMLPYATNRALEVLDARLETVLAAGGEGLMLRHPGSTWEPRRTQHLLKVKPHLDCEVVVRGYVSGRATSLGSKLLGMMGALVVDFQGRRLEISGFRDSERVMHWSGCNPNLSEEDRLRYASAELTRYPGQDVDVTQITNHQFPIGSRVTIRYRELTRDGIPKEGRYYRKHED